MAAILECHVTAASGDTGLPVHWPRWLQPARARFSCEEPVESLGWLFAAITHLQLPMGRRAEPFIADDLINQIRMRALMGGFGDPSSPSALRRADDWRAAVKAAASAAPEEELAWHVWAHGWDAEAVHYVAGILDRWTDVRPGGEFSSIAAGVGALLAPKPPEAPGAAESAPSGAGRPEWSGLFTGPEDVWQTLYDAIGEIIERGGSRSDYSRDRVAQHLSNTKSHLTGVTGDHLKYYHYDKLGRQWDEVVREAERRCAIQR